MEGIAAPAAAGDRIAVVSSALAAWEFAAVVTALARHGVAAVEATAGSGGHLALRSPRLLREARARLDAEGLAVCGVAATSALPLGDERLREVLELAAVLDAGFVRIFPPVFDPAQSVASQIERAGRALGALGSHGPQSLRLLVEPSPGTMAPSPELARRVVQQSGLARAGVVYDPASMAGEGHLQPSLAVAVLAGRLEHVHVKNRAPERRDGRWASAQAPLADGVVDWPQIMRALRQSHYAGRFSIDHLSGPASAAQLLVDVMALRTLLAG